MPLDITLRDATILVGRDEDFIINEDNVDGELCKAGHLLSYYGMLAVDLKTQLADARGNLEFLEATLSQNLRDTAKRQGEKLTEGNIKEKIIIDKDRQELLKKLYKFENDYLKLESLFRSQQKKVDCVIALAYKQRVEIQKSY